MKTRSVRGARQQNWLRRKRWPALLAKAGFAGACVAVAAGGLAMGAESALGSRNGREGWSQPWAALPRFLPLTGTLTLGEARAQDDGTSGRIPAAPERNSFWRGLFGCDVPMESVWSFEFAVGVISDNTLADYLEPKFNQLQGPGGGETYNFTVGARVHQFAWNVGSVTLRPELEVPMRLTLVAENRGRVVPDLNVGLVVRWRDFPWNKFLRTSLAAGPGFSYSFQVWTADYQRHPEDDERSRLKFWLPIEMTFALPRYPRHQLVAFIDHQSGGTLFDRGGVDAWGLGFRVEF